jgi:hypothetical protein
VDVLASARLIVVHIIVHVVRVAAHATSLHGVLFVILVQQLHEDLVVVVKPFGLDLLPPGVVVLLHVVENRVHENTDVRVFVTQQLKHNAHHLGLVKHDFPSGSKEQELEECVQDLLDHFIVLLFSAQHVLKELNQVAMR